MTLDPRTVQLLSQRQAPKIIYIEKKPSGLSTGFVVALLLILVPIFLILLAFVMGENSPEIKAAYRAQQEWMATCMSRNDHTTIWCENAMQAEIDRQTWNILHPAR